MALRKSQIEQSVQDSGLFDEYLRTTSSRDAQHSPTNLLPGFPSTEGTEAARMAVTEAEREEIYRLRYKVYIEEMHGENRHSEADRAARRLCDAWDERAYQFYVLQDGMVAACARLNLRRDGPLECEEQFGMDRFLPAFPDQVAMTSRLALHPKIRGSYLLKQLTCRIYEFLCDQGIRFNFIDCHPQLLPLYSRLGFRLYRPGFNHQKYTYVIPMVLVVDDLAHLEQVKSPFVQTARRFGYGASEPALPAVCMDSASRPNSETEAMFWDLLRDRLLDPTAAIEGFDLLEDLTIEETKLVVSLGHIVCCRAGDFVLNPGDPGREIFLILNGSFQVQRRAPGQPDGDTKILKILAAGDIFGEIRFLRDELRQAAVKAREDSTLLILNARALDRLVTTAPKVAAKLFRNLAGIVATRLCDSVRFLRFSRPRAVRRATPI
jgi:CRP-like cAMP-binding protein